MAACDIEIDSRLSCYSVSAESDVSRDGEEAEELQKLIDEIFGDSDEDEEEFEGFLFKVHQNIDWQRETERTPRPRRQEIVPADQQKKKGALVPLQQMTAFQLFKLFITVELVEQIVLFTNANTKMKWRGGDKCRLYDTNIEEIVAFISCLLIMNDFVALPSIHRYFTTDKKLWFLHSNSMGKIFSRHRFTQLKRYFQVSDPRKRNPRKGEEGYDALHKVRPLVYKKIPGVFLPRQKCFN